MTEQPGPASGGATLRLDKWLWYARFFKTRSQATQICAAGKVRVDGALVSKAHFIVRPGHVLTFVQGGQVRVIKVLALAGRRGPATEAQARYRAVAAVKQRPQAVPYGNPGDR